MNRKLVVSSRLILLGLMLLYGGITFSQAPAPARPRPSLVPLLWTQGQPPEIIRKVIQEVADGGNTGFVWESRPHPDYLGPKWWDDLGVAVAEARRLGLEVWIFDEWMYPSGVAGGKVVELDPAFTHHVLNEKTLTLEGPTEVRIWDIPGGLDKSETIVSVTSFPVPARPDAQAVDLAASAVDKDLRSVRWAVPKGRWRLTWAVSAPETPKAGWRMDTMIDVLNPKAVEAFIRLTHEATYAHFGPDFGKTIKGFFSDETGFRNATSYSSLPGTPGKPMPWSPAFAGYFQRRKGYDPRPLLASLWYDLGMRGRTARYDLMDAYADCFAETFFKPQQEWCRRHGVRLIGHLVEDNGADRQLGYGPGHWFRAMRYFDVPGIDIVGYQVTPGLDSGTNAWVANSPEPWDQEFFQFGLPAMARGAALIKSRTEIFSEAFGANGWGEGLRMAKWIGDWHFVNGIDFISPHAVTMKYHDPDCPPHFNRTSGNPQWRYYAVWADYAKRLQGMLLDSTPVFDAAVLYTAESGWVGPAETAAPVVRALENRQLTTVVLPYETWEKGGTLRNGRWIFNGQEFATVVLPSVRYAPSDVVARLADFAERGGRVVVVDRYPEGSVDGRGDENVRKSVERLKRAPGAALRALPEVGPTLVAAGAGVMSLEPRAPHLMASRRKAAGGEWILLHNRSLDANAAGRLVVRSTAEAAVRYDAAADAYRAVPSRRTAEGLEITIDIPPYGLWALFLADKVPPTEPLPVYRDAREFRPSWEVVELDDEGREAKPATIKKELADWRRWPGWERFAGTMRYRAALRIESAQAGAGFAVDAGVVGEIAELKINGKSAGVRIAPPYLWEISGLVQAGNNVLEIEVTNTAQVRWADAFSRGEPVSGLLGPVRILSTEKLIQIIAD